MLRAELVACCARPYGLARKEFLYIFDPDSLSDSELEIVLDTVEDPQYASPALAFPGETFRVVKNREIKEFGEYRTGPLIMAAWDASSFE